MFRRPPALAVWVLDRLGYTRSNAALAGDMLEDFRNGRTAGWYWRQTLAVIGAGFARHLSSTALYLLAVTVGYAVQLPASYALWSMGFPVQVTRSGWGQAGLWALMQGVAWLAGAAVMKRTVGQWTLSLRPMFRAAGSDRQKRATILALAGYDSFSFGFWSYCLCGVVFRHFSRTEFWTYESIWFVLWVFAPAVLPALAAPATCASEPVEDREQWLAIAQREPVITVALSDGRTIRMERERVAEAVFAASDPELTRVVFGRGKSLDLLRRAVWLGGYRSHSHIQGRTESFTVAELAALIAQTSRLKSVTEAEWNGRESLGVRLKVWFCGDSV